MAAEYLRQALSVRPYKRQLLLRGRCPVDGEPVWSFRADAVYCSSRCRVRAHRAGSPESARAKLGANAVRDLSGREPG
jgi:hypothetical protein